ncbi:hypothetical protein [Craterilacuibacter sp.]|uniref:hypothetical protein n=1 Tax=Craterilacuibacter sp. TaxID=2870909 RepID=UPI003F2E1278
MWIWPHFLGAEVFSGARPGWSQRYAALLLYPALLWSSWQLRFLPLQSLLLAGSIACGLGLWALNYRRYRAVADTPTARTRSAALGYTEFYGHSRAHTQAPLFSHISGRACVWYRWHKQYQGQGYRQRGIESGQSEASFLLQDDSGGEVIIHPEGAGIEPAHQRVTVDDGWRITEQWIAAGDPLYVLGTLSAIGGAPLDAQLRAEVKLELEQLKQDQAQLLARFDGNRDGRIDQQEWEEARQSVAAQVRREYAELAAAPPTHHLMAPADGRPYLISPRSPRATARHFRTLAWLHLAAGTLACLLQLYI